MHSKNSEKNSEKNLSKKLKPGKFDFFHPESTQKEVQYATDEDMIFYYLKFAAEKKTLESANSPTASSPVNSRTAISPQRHIHELIDHDTQQDGYNSDSSSIFLLSGDDEGLYKEARQEVKTLGDEFEVWAFDTDGNIVTESL